MLRAAGVWLLIIGHIAVRFVLRCVRKPKPATPFPSALQIHRAAEAKRIAAAESEIEIKEPEGDDHAVL